MTNKARKIGSREFVGGTIRDVYEDADGRQFVLNDDKLPVYGVWLLVDEPAVAIGRNLGSQNGDPD